MVRVSGAYSTAPDDKDAGGGAIGEGSKYSRRLPPPRKRVRRQTSSATSVQMPVFRRPSFNAEDPVPGSYIPKRLRSGLASNPKLTDADENHVDSSRGMVPTDDDAQTYSSDHSTHSHQLGQRKKGRKGTRMKKLKRSNGQKVKLSFDSHFEPNGPDKESVDNFVSYLGLLARSKVSILIKSWANVSDKNKEQVWQALLEKFEVPDDLKLKKKWLQFAGERWRGFKTSLNRYIFGDRKGLLPYVEDYKFIDPRTWEAFVASRQTPEFLAKRRKAQEAQSHNKCPHTLSRGGYKNLNKKIAEEKSRSRHEASSDPSVFISPPSPPSRHESWKRARMTSDGKYVSKEARLVCEKIDSLEEQRSRGSFTPIGRHDILATALGKLEHPGRVRGVGKGVGIKDYFGRAPRTLVSREDLEIVINQVKQETQLELQKDWEKLKEQMKVEMRMMIDTQPITRDCTLDQTPLNAHKQDEEYELYVEHPQRRLVAYGRVHHLGPSIHHRRMNDDEVRVVVVRVVVGDAVVPCPTGEVTLVWDAVNLFVAWPKRLVQNVKEISQPKQVDPKPLPEANTNVLKLLWIAAADITQPININIEAGIVCANITGDKRDLISISQKNIMELLQTQKLSISVMQFYNKYLYNILKAIGRDKKYGLMCPLTIQSKGNTKQEIAVYIRTRMTEGDFECFLAPYLSEDLWQLMVLCPKQNVVTWFCPMWKRPKKELTKMIDTTFEAYRAMKGNYTYKVNKPKWVCPKCRKQMGGEAGGYFVMRYMLEIITLDVVDSFEKVFDNEEPYSKEDIDDIRRRWTQYFLDVTSLVK